MHERGVSAQEVDAGFRGGFVQGPRNRPRVRLADQAYGRHADALVDNRNAEFPFDGLAGGHQLFPDPAYFFVYARRASVCVPVGAIQQVDSQGDGSDVKVLLLNHPQRLQNFTRFNHMLCRAGAAPAKITREGSPPN